jgi:hypothetical protein
MQERLKRLHSPTKIRESLPPDLSSRLASAAPLLIIGWGHNKHDRPSRKGSASTDAQTVVRGRGLIPGGETAFGMIVSGRNPGEFWGILRDRCTILMWL